MIFLYLGVLAAIAIGLILLARRPPLSDADYERLKGKGSGVGNALLSVQSLIEPDKKDLLEARQEERAEEDDTGDPPDPQGGSGGRGRRTEVWKARRAPRENTAPRRTD